MKLALWCPSPSLQGGACPAGKLCQVSPTSIQPESMGWYADLCICVFSWQQAYKILFYNNLPFYVSTSIVYSRYHWNDCFLKKSPEQSCTTCCHKKVSVLGSNWVATPPCLASDILQPGVSRRAPQKVRAVGGGHVIYACTWTHVLGLQKGQSLPRS